MTNSIFRALALLAATFLGAGTAAAATANWSGGSLSPGKPVGSITISQGTAGFILTAGYGGGVLHYKGKAYPFRIGGLGLGGIGAASLKATGQVYSMANVTQFAGPYGSVQAGAVVGDKSVGTIWLKNANGVVIRLNAKLEGLMLTTGGDAILITMK